MKVKTFCVNMMHENTYVVFDDSGECVIIDCGCYTDNEKQQLLAFIDDNGLVPKRLLCTHVHLDHIFGNSFVRDTYGLEAEASDLDHLLAEMMHFQFVSFGLNDADIVIPTPSYTLTEGMTITFGHSELQVIATPGHTAGSVSFYNAHKGILFSGDLIMKGATGATDLPLSKRPKLIASIRDRIFKLPDSTVIYAGHGEPTNVGAEKLSNPIIKEL